MAASENDNLNLYDLLDQGLMRTPTRGYCSTVLPEIPIAQHVHHESWVAAGGGSACNDAL